MSRSRTTLTPVEACHSISRWGEYQSPQMWVRDPDFELEWEFDYPARVCHLRFFRQGQWLLQDILLRGTPQKFGGEMFFLVCPECSTKRGKLFLPDNVYRDLARGLLVRAFLCRDCYHLTYLQRQHAYINQIHAQEYRLKRHLAKHFADIENPENLHEKPHQHHDQFEKHYAKYQAIQARALAADEVWGWMLVAKVLRATKPKS